MTGCLSLGSDCEPHPCAPDEHCDPTNPIATGGYEHCTKVYLGVRVTTPFEGTFDPATAAATFEELGYDARIDGANASATVGDVESVDLRVGLTETSYLVWLHDAKRHRSGVGGEQSLALMREDRVRLEPRFLEVLGAIEHATGLERADEPTWHPATGVN